MEGKTPVQTVHPYSASFGKLLQRTKCQVIYLEMSAPPGWVAVRNSPSRLRRVKYSGLAQFDTRRWV